MYIWCCLRLLGLFGLIEVSIGNSLVFPNFTMGLTLPQNPIVLTQLITSLVWQLPSSVSLDCKPIPNNRHIYSHVQVFKYYKSTIQSWTTYINWIISVPFLAPYIRAPSYHWPKPRGFYSSCCTKGTIFTIGLVYIFSSGGLDDDCPDLSIRAWMDSYDYCQRPFGGCCRFLL